MKLGIVTFNRANNFGAFLQAYALNSYLSSCGHEVEFIDVKFNPAVSDGKSSGVPEKSGLRKISDGVVRRLKAREFDKLRNKYFNTTPYFIDGDSDKSAFVEKYDAVIAGSDQIWNTEITHGTEAFYLDFVKKARKISYAASYGTAVLDDTEKEYTLRNLPSFRAVSVRESENAVYLNDTLGIEASVVCDPVFLPKRKEWLSMMNVKRKKYILVYYMEKSRQLVSAVKAVRKKYGLPVKYVQGGLDRIEGTFNTFVGSPIQFLETIAGAEIIVTNSFHATAFSLIFNKRLYVAGHSKWNVRLDNLMEYSGYKELIIDNGTELSPDSIQDYEIDGKKAYRNIVPLIKQSRKFLYSSLK